MTAKRLKALSDDTLARKRREKSVNQIAKQYGVCPWIVGSELRKRGIKSASGAAKLTATKVRTIRRRLTAGESMASLSREYGVWICTIRDIRDFITWKWVK